MAEYQGWKNKATWNVALYIMNEYGLHMAAREYVAICKRSGMQVRYGGYLDYACLRGLRTPDGFKFDGTRLCVKELREMLEGLAD